MDKILHTDFLEVYAQTYSRNNHNSTLYSIKTKPRSVLVVAINEKNEVLITKEFRPVINSWVYSVPGGFVEEGETVEQAAARELAEETGLNGGSFQLINTVFPLPGLLIQSMGIVKATGPFILQPSQQEPFESIETGWYSPHQVKALLSEQNRWDSQALASLAICLM